MTDDELIARLRAWDGTPFDDEAKAAADRIEALVREKTAAYAQGYGDCEAEISLTEIGRTNEFLHGQIAKWKAHAERLAATKWRLEAALRELRHRWYLGDLQEKDFTAALPDIDTFALENSND